MSIPVEHEDIEQLKLWGLGLEKVIEKCYFCGDPTRYWYKPANKPVCTHCAKDHNPSEIPPMKKKVKKE